MTQLENFNSSDAITTSGPLDFEWSKRSDLLETSLLELAWFVLWRNRLIVAAITAACLVFTLVGTLLTTLQYDSVARLQINRIQSNVSDVQGVEPEGSVLQFEEFYNTQYALLDSTSLAERVVRSLGLVSDERFLEVMKLTEVEGVTSGSTQEVVQFVSEGLLDNVTIEPVRGSSLVDVRFSSPSPNLSARIAGAWVSEFIELSIERRFAATNDARVFLRSQLAELRERLEDSERQFVTYASNSGIIAVPNASGDLGARGTLVGTDLAVMNAALSVARADRIAAESALRAGAVDARNEILASLRVRRAQVSAEHASLFTQFKDGYPPLGALTEQLGELDAQIIAEEQRSVGGLQRAFVAAAEREKMLSSEVSEAKHSFLGEQRATIQYNILRRDVDTNRELYNGLLQRYKEIGIAGVAISNAQLIDPPRVPAEPSSPNLPLNMALGLLAGFAASGGFLFVRDQIDRTLRNPSDVKDVLGAPLLGIIPRFRDEVLEQELLDPKSEMAEAYDSVATMLDLSTDHGFPKSLMHTSAAPNEGKTSSSIAIASRLARMGKRTVLVDFDLRNPSIGARLSLSGKFGVTNYLTGQDNIEEFIHVNVQENLDVLCAGVKPPNPGELFASPRIAQLFNQLGAEYDHLIIDAAPILGIADAPILATHTDGVVLIIEANRIRLRQLASALDRIHGVRGNVLGAVVTKLDGRNSDYGYGKGYGYGYGYGKDAALAVAER